MTFPAGSDSLAHKRGRGAQPEGTQVCALIETHQRRLRFGGDVPCYEQEVAVPDDHTLLLSLKVDEYPGCSLGGFASVTKNPKVLFFTEPGPGRTAPASATAEPDEDSVVLGDTDAGDATSSGRLQADVRTRMAIHQASRCSRRSGTAGFVSGSRRGSRFIPGSSDRATTS
jgi:hypothetical protein